MDVINSKFINHKNTYPNHQVNVNEDNTKRLLID